MVNFWNLLYTYHITNGYFYFLFLRKSFMCFGIVADFFSDGYKDQIIFKHTVTIILKEYKQPFQATV